MPFFYKTGEQINAGDQVLYCRRMGHVEFVTDPLVRDPRTDWYLEEFGEGVMVIEPECFGHVFLQEPEDAEQLSFVSRSEARGSSPRVM